MVNLETGGPEGDSPDERPRRGVQRKGNGSLYTLGRRPQKRPRRACGGDETDDSGDECELGIFALDSGDECELGVFALDCDSDSTEHAEPSRSVSSDSEAQGGPDQADEDGQMELLTWV